MSEINDLVKALDDNNKNVDFRRHIGGGRYVSVTSGIVCVDFRKFFCPSGTDEIKPTPSRVPLHIHEWWKFVDNQVHRRCVSSTGDSSTVLHRRWPFKPAGCASVSRMQPVWNWANWLFEQIRMCLTQRRLCYFACDCLCSVQAYSCRAFEIKFAYSNLCIYYYYYYLI